MYTGLTIMKKKILKIVKYFVVTLSIILVIFVGSSYYFFHVAEVRSHKSFINNSLGKGQVYKDYQWFNKQNKQHWYEIGEPGNLRLDADYLPAKQKTNNTVVIVHGFSGSKKSMFSYGTMFHDLGFNVLIPDDRASGQSQGKYIGYGWLDRKDYLDWIHKVIQHNGKSSKILMFGVSMGGATTIMTSGERVPKQVKAYIADCGYTSVYDEITYQAKQMYHLPQWPFVPMVSEISKVLAGYSYQQASAIKQIKKNHRPILIIHGSKDTFVPTWMGRALYRAANKPKELWIVPGAKHAGSFKHNPYVYQQHINNFLKQYFFNN